MTRFFRWLKIEIRHILPIFVFFFLSFFIISQTETFLLKRAGLRPFTLVDITVAAALVAKIFLVIDHLPLERLIASRPLIFLVFFKSFLYWAVAFLVRIGILFFPYLYLKEGIVHDWDVFFHRMNWNLMASVQAWCLMLLFLFVSFRELARVIGPVKMRKIFFG